MPLNKETKPNLLLSFRFPFSELPSPFISLFLTEINLYLLVKSLMKLNTLDGAQPWSSAQIVTVKTNSPSHHHSNLYLFLFLSFLSGLFFRPFPPFKFLSLLYLFPHLLNFKEIIFILKKFFFSMKNEISKLLNPSSVLVFPLIFIIMSPFLYGLSLDYYISIIKYLKLRKSHYPIISSLFRTSFLY